MKLRMVLVTAVFVLGAAAIVAAAVAFNGSSVKAQLSGYQEIPTLSTQGKGTFQASIDKGQNQIKYTLTYSGPFDANPAGGTVTQAHIHLGARAFSGGISAFLCSNLGNGPAGTPACPQPAPGEYAEVTGTRTAADVVGPAAQGIAPGEFAELVRALRAGVTYANVHSAQFPTGEIRGQFDGRGANDD